MPTGQSANRPPLRTVREAQGLSLREVARRAQVDPAHLGRVERGEARFSVDTLVRVAAVLGLRPLADLLGQYAKAIDETAPAQERRKPRAGATT